MFAAINTTSSQGPNARPQRRGRVPHPGSPSKPQRPIRPPTVGGTRRQPSLGRRVGRAWAQVVIGLIACRARCRVMSPVLPGSKARKVAVGSTGPRCVASKMAPARLPRRQAWPARIASHRSPVAISLSPQRKPSADSSPLPGVRIVVERDAVAIWSRWRSASMTGRWR